jgi:hypothetical protein
MLPQHKGDYSILHPEQVRQCFFCCCSFLSVAVAVGCSILHSEQAMLLLLQLFVCVCVCFGSVWSLFVCSAAAAAAMLSGEWWSRCCRNRSGTTPSCTLSR